ncbi:hypothetical protein HMPREF9444_02206 [Succinatimonas hippei YIT 12066]|uniref:Uncharacterized protein n=1 Tax=Succinatimonas hippei (strain DSM 22608 / JCM 16073 / KCTC 15190 / YIT 12066) TaxID=762983 RepID=E8LN52_SUCHY|nr:hypothetical protein HMPREF9444_02206 [Succinatimonas hippei YIT 12066]
MAIKHIANTPRLLFIPTRTVITVDRMDKAYGKNMLIRSISKI